MIHTVVMPPLGATGGELVIEAWLVQPDQYVEAGSPLLVVVTDKATVEVEAFQAGYLRQILINAGEAVESGAVIAYVSDNVSEPIPSAKLPSELLTATAMHASRILISPIARRIAAREGLDIAVIRGSGRGAAILKRDVLAALAPSPPTPHPEEEGSDTTRTNRHGVVEASPAPTVTPTTMPNSLEVTLDVIRHSRRVPLSPMRRAIARRTHQSKNLIPHFYASMTLDMSAAESFLALAAEQADKYGWRTPTMNDLIIHGVALSLRHHPYLNASYDEDALLLHEAINIGMVIGVEDGMIIPVVHQADRFSLFALASATQRSKERTRRGELTDSDLAGGTFTISNLGMFGLDEFTAVINPPEAAILAIGAIREEAAVKTGQVISRSVMSVTLSVDHRVADGVIAARFMQTLRELLENPLLFALQAQQEVS